MVFRPLHEESRRLQAAAALLRARPDLGPPAFRDAVARWLARCGAETGAIRARSGNYCPPTLPEVLSILDVIETPREHP